MVSILNTCASFAANVPVAPMFDPAIIALLEHYSNNRPPTEDAWYGPWNSILTTLFPSSQNYVVVPQRLIVAEDNVSRIPDFVMEVLQLSTPPLTMRTVLIVEVKNTHWWPEGINGLENQTTGVYVPAESV